MNVQQAKNLVTLIQKAMSLLQPIIVNKDKEKLEELNKSFNEIYQLLRDYVNR